MSNEQTRLGAGEQSPPLSPGLNLDIIETVQIKEEPEEHSVKQEEVQLPVCVPESSSLCLKRQESALPQQRQTECAPKTSASVNNVDKSGEAEAAGGKKHQCPVCKKRYGTKQQLKIHNRLHTGERPYSCHMCKKTFTQRGHLDSHMRTHVGEIIYNCPICEIDFSNHSSFTKHLRTHKEEPANCSRLSLSERTIADSEEKLSGSKEENQRKSHLLSPRVLPLRAGVQTPLLSPEPSLHQEISETPQIKEEPEEQSILVSKAVCVKTEESSLFQGRQTEHKEESHVEDLSSEHSSETDNDDDWEISSLSAGQMETHTTPKSSDIDQGAEGKKYPCSVCKKTFWTKQGLRAHVRIHTGEQLYTCPTCNKPYAHKSNLQAHMRKHTGEKPFSCSICKKTFSWKCTVKKHMRTHTGEKAAVNNGERFGDEGAEEKKYQCPFCCKRFWTNYHLQRHYTVHTGDRPYSCTVCQETFTDQSVLRTHMRTHTGEKPYSCPTCQKAFANKSNFKKHLRTHTGEKPFSCSVCQKTFGQKGNLSAHLRTHKGQHATAINEQHINEQL